MTVLLDDFARFVANVEASSLYLKWKNDNHGEDALWAAMRVAILTGAAPLPVWPKMMTRFGQALIDVARLYVDATHAPLTVKISGVPAKGETLKATVT